MPYHCWYTHRAANGPVGAKGAAGRAGSRGSVGNNGTVSIVRDGVEPLLTQRFSYTYFHMVVHDAEMDYLNERHEEASNKLVWCLELLEEDAPLCSETADREMGERLVDEGDNNRRNSLISRIRLLLIQMCSGVDYYGFYPNHVPLTSLELYESSVDNMMKLATDIDAFYGEFYNQEQSAIKHRLAIDGVIETLELKSVRLHSQESQIDAEIEAARAHIKELLNEEIVLEVKVKAAERAFKDALEREAECGIDDVLKAAVAVASIASGIGTVAAGIASLSEMNDLVEQKKLKDTFKDQAKYIVKHSKVVGKGLGKIKNGYEEVKVILDEERDAAKLISAEEDFEESVKRFEHLSEAREYRRLMRQYLGVIKTRNNKILEVDNNTTRFLELATEREQLSTELDATRGRLVQVYNPRLAEHVVFFERAVRRVRAALLRAIVMEHKALEYWGLESNLVPANIHDRDIEYLKVFHFSFKENLLRLIEERNAVPQRLTVPPITLTREDNPNIFELFDETGQFSFELKAHHHYFRVYSRVLVNNVTITLEEPAYSGYRWLKLRHYGNPTFVDNQGDYHSYSHRGRDRALMYPPLASSASVSLGGEIGRYSYLSPFATWGILLEYTDDDSRPIDYEVAKQARETVTSIQIAFEGIADVRYAFEEERDLLAIENAK